MGLGRGVAAFLACARALRRRSLTTASGTRAAMSRTATCSRAPKYNDLSTRRCGSVRNHAASSRGRNRPGDKWYMDEVFLTIKGERQYLWRAVDQEGNVLDILVQRRRDKRAAKKFFRKLLKGLTYVPRVIITDKLKSYGAAKREILPGIEHRQHRYLNNRAENSHQPTRQRERPRQRFKSPGHAQRFLSAYGGDFHHFRPGRDRLSALAHRQELRNRFQIGRQSRVWHWPHKGQK